MAGAVAAVTVIVVIIIGAVKMFIISISIKYFSLLFKKTTIIFVQLRLLLPLEKIVVIAIIKITIMNILILFTVIYLCGGFLESVSFQSTESKSSFQESGWVCEEIVDGLCAR